METKRLFVGGLYNDIKEVDLRCVILLIFVLTLNANEDYTLIL